MGCGIAYLRYCSTASTPKKRYASAKIHNTAFPVDYIEAFQA